MENNQEDKEAGIATLEDDSNDSKKKRYRYRRIYDDVGEKSFGKKLAFFQKWFYLLASVLLVIAILLIGMTFKWHIKVTELSVNLAGQALDLNRK